MYAGFSPFLPSPISMPSLVATITLLRLSPFASHLPRMVSDSPPLWPGIQREYTSAVSIKFSPASSAASSCRKESASDNVHPKTLPPRQRIGTSKSDLPSLTRSIAISLFFYDVLKARPDANCLGSRIGGRDADSSGSGHSGLHARKFSRPCWTCDLSRMNPGPLPGPGVSSYLGTKRLVFQQQQLYWMLSFGFVSGHDFSRALKEGKRIGLQPLQ